MPSTFSFIAKATPTSWNFTFTNIPQTYTDLCIIGHAKSGSGAVYEDIAIQLNGVGQDYKTQIIVGTNTGYANFSNGTGLSNYIEWQRGIVGSNAAMSGSYSPVWFYFPVYRNTSLNRTVLWRSGYSNTAAGGAGTFNGGMTLGGALPFTVGTSAITSIYMYTLSINNFASGSSFVLYGINNS